MTTFNSTTSSSSSSSSSRSNTTGGVFPPPPYTYEKSYSSYKVEWEEHVRQQSQNDVDITDVAWLQYGKTHQIDDDDDDTEEVHRSRAVQGGHQMQRYLLGCTSLGEVIVWKIPSWNPQLNATETYHTDATDLDGAADDSMNRPQQHTKPIYRIQLPALMSSSSISSSSSTTTTSRTSSHHRKYKIVVVTPSSRPMKSRNSKSEVSRKRNRSSLAEEEGPDDGGVTTATTIATTIANTLIHGVCFIASEDGLWRIPLATLFSSKGNHNNVITKNNQGDVVVSTKTGVKRLVMNRPISHIQVFHENEQQQDGKQTVPFLYALERDCISKWNVMEYDDSDGRENGVVGLDQPIATYPLAPWFDLTNQRSLEPKVQEKATTMLVVSDHTSLLSSDSDPLVLVGTNHGRVLIVPTHQHNNDERSSSSSSSSSSPQYISVIQNTGSTTTAIAPRLSLSSNTPICWTVTSIMETHNTWWTVAVVASLATSSSLVTTLQADIASAISTIVGKRLTGQLGGYGGGGRKVSPNITTVDPAPSGFLSTWYAPTRALIAIRPTHESVHTIIPAVAMPSTILLGAMVPTNKAYTANTMDDANDVAGSATTPTAATVYTDGTVTTTNAYSSLSTTSASASSSSFYSIGNESVVSVWKSPYQLERIGRIWTSTPSGKAMAVCCTGVADDENDDDTNTNANTSRNGNGNVSISNHRNDTGGCWVAIAGIGCNVDIVLDRCCVATMQL
jgi:hypothetical protein